MDAMALIRTTYAEMDRLLEWAAADIRGRIGRFIADQDANAADGKSAGSTEGRL